MSHQIEVEKLIKKTYVGGEHIGYRAFCNVCRKHEDLEFRDSPTSDANTIRNKVRKRLQNKPCKPTKFEARTGPVNLRLSKTESKNTTTNWFKSPMPEWAAGPIRRHNARKRKEQEEENNKR